MNQTTKKDWCGDTSPNESITPGKVVFSPTIIPQNDRQFNHRATGLLLDKAIERQDWHTERAAECRRDIRFYQAALGWHQDQADRARRIRAELERLVL